MTLLFNKIDAQVHFVDIVPELMDKLEQQLQQYFPITPDLPDTWKVHCIDVAKLPIEAHEGRHLVIISGVGGDLTSELLNAIHQSKPCANIDYLLCPANRPQYVRRTLIELGFYCLEEQLVEENKRYYEVLTVSADAERWGSTSDSAISPQPVSLLGDKFWQPRTPEALDIATRYRQQTLAHYQRMQRSGDPQAAKMVEAWERIAIQQTLDV